MAESISICERILRVVRLRGEDVTGVHAAYRQDARGQRNYKNGDVIVQRDDEHAAEDAEGSWSLMLWELPVIMAQVITVDEGDATESDVLVNRALARLEYAIHGGATFDQKLTEPTDVGNEEALADDIVLTDRLSWQEEDGRLVAAIVFTVKYRTNRGNPYLGPGVTLLQE